MTKPQLTRLQTLYAQLVRHEMGMDASREGRMMWATERLGRKISSFSEITFNEAIFLIDGLQGQLGVKAPFTGRPGRAQARRAGLDGRKDGGEFDAAPQIASPEDMARIQRVLDVLGWTADSYRTFQQSTRFPLARRADKAIRTLSDANKVYWALKRIAQSKGIWRKSA